MLRKNAERHFNLEERSVKTQPTYGSFSITINMNSYNKKFNYT